MKIVFIIILFFSALISTNGLLFNCLVFTKRDIVKYSVCEFFSFFVIIILSVCYIILLLLDICNLIIQNTMLIRLIDYVSCNVLFISWLFYITKNNKIRGIVLFISSFEFVFHLIFVTRDMESSYYITDEFKLCWLVFTCILVLFKPVLLIASLKKSSQNQIFNVSVTAATVTLVLILLYQYSFDMSLSFRNIISDSVNAVSVLLICFELLAFGVFLSINLLKNTIVPHMFQNDCISFLRFQNDYGISDRELEVTKLIYSRYTDKAISDILNISINTVKTHNKSVYSKSHVSGRNDLIMLIDRKYR